MVQRNFFFLCLLTKRVLVRLLHLMMKAKHISNLHCIELRIEHRSRISKRIEEIFFFHWKFEFDRIHATFTCSIGSASREVCVHIIEKKKCISTNNIQTTMRLLIFQPFVHSSGLAVVWLAVFSFLSSLFALTVSLFVTLSNFFSSASIARLKVIDLEMRWPKAPCLST